MAIEFKVHISLQEYRRFNFSVAYRRPYTILFTAVGLVQIIGFAVYELDPFIEKPVNLYFPLIMGIFFIIFRPLTIYFRSKDMYEANRYLRDGTEWSIDEHKIKITGSSFSTEMEWNTLHKVQNYKQWILLYTGKPTAYIVPYKAFESSLDYRKFEEYAKKNNLPFK